MNFNTLEYCTVCSSGNLKNIYTTYDRHYGIKGDFKIDQCTDCGLVFLNPMPTQDHLTSLYPQTYYSYQDFFDKKPSFLKKIYKEYFVKIGTKDPKFPVPGKILDVGCGSGKFLYAMREKGWEVAGVEVNTNAAKLGNEVAQLNIHPDDLMSANYADASFDYVRSNHSFEHITNPDEVLKEMYRVLKKDGKLMIGVPNIDSFNARRFKKYWWYLGAPVHPYNYSVSTLSRLLEKHGFKVEKVTYNGDYSGVIGSIQIYLNRNNGKRSDEGFLFNNAIVRLLAHQFARLLNAFKTGDAIEITCTK